MCLIFCNTFKREIHDKRTNQKLFSNYDVCYQKKIPDLQFIQRTKSAMKMLSPDTIENHNLQCCEDLLHFK